MAHPRLRRLARDVAVLVAVLIAVTLWQRRGLLGAGEPAPPLRLAALDGQVVDLADLRGKTVLLHFWATWCGVCRQEHGALAALDAERGPDEVLLTIAADDDPEVVRRYVAEEGLTYPVLLADRATLAAYKVSKFPTNYFVGPDGDLRARDVGMSTRWGLRARLGCAGGDG